MTWPNNSTIAGVSTLRILRSYDTDMLELRLSPEELKWMTKALTYCRDYQEPSFPAEMKQLLLDLEAFDSLHGDRDD